MEFIDTKTETFEHSNFEHVKLNPNEGLTVCYIKDSLLSKIK